MGLQKQNLYKKIVEKLTSKGEKLNLSERSINEQLETLIGLFGNDTITEDEFIEKTISIFKTADNNVRNDVSVGIKKYEEEKKDKPTPTGSNTESEEIKSLMKRLAKLEEENSKNANAKLVIQKQGDIKNYLKTKGLDNEQWIDLMLSQINVTPETDSNTKGEELLGIYNKMTSEDVKVNITPRKSSGGNEDSQLESILKEAGSLVKNSI
ncbi:MAG: hypothetical protein ACI35S_06785 [Anaeroplasma sp.]